MSAVGSVMIDEVIPVSETRVSIRVAAEEVVDRVRLEPEGVDLEFELRDGRVDVVVDSLSVHSMVVVDAHRPPADAPSEPRVGGSQA